jgi:hypothetical protein
MCRNEPHERGRGIHNWEINKQATAAGALCSGLETGSQDSLLGRPGVRLFQGSTALKEKTLSEFSPHSSRLQLWVQGVVAAERPTFGDALRDIEVGGAAEAPFEEHEVVVHFHRHQLLLEGRWKVAAMDEM